MSNTNAITGEANQAEPSGQDQTVQSPPETPTIQSFLSPERVLAQLSTVRKTQPVVAIAAANQYQRELTGPFLEAVERALTNPIQDFAEHGMLFNYAAYFLAKWREPRAYPLFLRWFSLPGEGAFELGGDTVTHGARFLAAVCGRDIEPLKQLFLNRDGNAVCRGEALKAICLLSIWGERPREEVGSYFLFLAREGLAREKDPGWHFLAALCLQLEFVEVFPELRRALVEGFLDPGFLRTEDLDQAERATRGLLMGIFKERNLPITNVIEETRWWAGYDPARASVETSAEAEREKGIVAAGQQYVAPQKVGRNDPCPCGSGKKFKKCHGQ